MSGFNGITKAASERISRRVADAMKQAGRYNNISGDVVSGLTPAGSGGFTVPFVAQPTTLAKGEGIIAGLSCSIYKWTNNALYVGNLADLGSVQGFFSNANEPVFGAYVRDPLSVGSEGKVYKNGTLVGSFPDATNWANPFTAIASGAGVFSGSLRAGFIHGVSTAAEIAAAYKNQLPRWWFPSVPAGTPLITGDDSTFDSNGNWIRQTGVTISGGSLVFTSTPIYEGARLVDKQIIGQKYRAVFSDVNITAGTLITSDDVVITGNGTYDYIAINTFFKIQAGSATVSGTIGNVTLIPLGAQLFTDTSQPGHGYFHFSPHNVPGYVIRDPSNTWALPGRGYGVTPELTRTGPGYLVGDRPIIPPGARVIGLEMVGTAINYVDVGISPASPANFFSNIISGYLQPHYFLTNYSNCPTGKIYVNQGAGDQLWIKVHYVS